MTSPRSARDECYHRMRESMKIGIRQYYRDFPERMRDERSTVAIERSLEGLAELFKILDTFDITYRTEET